MMKRAAALLALLCFGGAWLVGVWHGHSPWTRLEDAFLALLFGLVAGALGGFALQKIILGGIADQMPAAGELPKDDAPKNDAKLEQAR